MLTILLDIVGIVCLLSGIFAWWSTIKFVKQHKEKFGDLFGE